MWTSTCCLLIQAVVVGPAQDIQVERVFGPEAPAQYKHPASITELANGDLYLVYYGGAGEYATDTAVYGSRRAKGGTGWTRPRIIADTPDRSEGNAVIWQAPDGRVWLFYLTRYGRTWSTSRIKAKHSDDGAKTWSEPFLLDFEQGLMVRNRPLVLRDGNYLLPIYHEVSDDRESVGPGSTSLFLRYDKTKKTWSQTGRIRSATGNIQPAVVQLGDTHLIAYCRRGGGYGPTTDGYMIRAESHDGGQTWTEGKNAPFPNPNAAIDFLKLQSGSLLLVYNDSMSRRTPLAAALSTDNDKTYPHRRNLVEGPGPYAYPYAIQTRDGKIHVIFTSHDRTVINHAVFTEDAVRRAER